MHVMDKQIVHRCLELDRVAPRFADLEIRQRHVVRNHLEHLLVHVGTAGAPPAV